jgi:hypothetical protein
VRSVIDGLVAQAPVEKAFELIAELRGTGAQELAIEFTVSIHKGRELRLAPDEDERRISDVLMRQAHQPAAWPPGTPRPRLSLPLPYHRQP